jgi:hypothetical protein
VPSSLSRWCYGCVCAAWCCCRGEEAEARGWMELSWEAWKPQSCLAMRPTREQMRVSLFSGAGGGHQTYSWGPWRLWTWLWPGRGGRREGKGGFTKDQTIKNRFPNKLYRIAYKPKHNCSHKRDEGHHGQTSGGCVSLKLSSGMEVGPQLHHIVVRGGSNHDGSSLVLQASAPVVPSGITRCGGLFIRRLRAR